MRIADTWFAVRSCTDGVTMLWEPLSCMAGCCDDETHRFFVCRMVAPDRDKALFCQRLCRSVGVRGVVEDGTSFGVSTLCPAAAIRDNSLENEVMIATEHEPAKATCGTGSPSRKAHSPRTGNSDGRKPRTME
ncbi:MAG: hypothetical protein GDA49_00375 [Rhodospirillales bacterium]|nr:hypothetical protein [Rhodospirillales bacterium]